MDRENDVEYLKRQIETWSLGFKSLQEENEALKGGLTAENGVKYAMIGDFKVSGKIIPWSTIKEIYKKGVEVILKDFNKGLGGLEK
jgi:hypothetical protein